MRDTPLSKTSEKPRKRYITSDNHHKSKNNHSFYTFTLYVYTYFYIFTILTLQRLAYKTNYRNPSIVILSKGLFTSVTHSKHSKQLTRYYCNKWSLKLLRYYCWFPQNSKFTFCHCYVCRPAIFVIVMGL